MENNMREHAKREYPREACGLVVEIEGEEIYFPCKNLSENSDQDFILDLRDYADAEDAGTIRAVFHSHPNGSCNPSPADLVSCETSMLPWVILSWPANSFYRFAPTGYSAELEGRPFYYGVLDCCTLCRDLYSRELSIDFECIDSSGVYPKLNWWEDKGADYYVDNFESQGFVKLTDETPKKYDIFLMKVASHSANHAAVYLGGCSIIHHLSNRLSIKEVYTGYWQKHTVHHLRHKSLC